MSDELLIKYSEKDKEIWYHISTHRYEDKDGFMQYKRPMLPRSEFGVDFLKRKEMKLNEIDVWIKTNPEKHFLALRFSTQWPDESTKQIFLRRRAILISASKRENNYSIKEATSILKTHIGCLIKDTFTKEIFTMRSLDAWLVLNYPSQFLMKTKNSQLFKSISSINSISLK